MCVTQKCDLCFEFLSRVSSSSHHRRTGMVSHSQNARHGSILRVFIHLSFHGHCLDVNWVPNAGLDTQYRKARSRISASTLLIDQDRRPQEQKKTGKTKGEWKEWSPRSYVSWVIGKSKHYPLGKGVSTRPKKAEDALCSKVQRSETAGYICVGINKEFGVGSDFPTSIFSGSHTLFYFVLFIVVVVVYCFLTI